LVIYTERIPQIIEEIWREAITDTNLGLTPGDVDLKHKRYTAAYAQQERCSNKEEHAVNLTGALSGLQNLHIIKVASPDWYKNEDPNSSITSVWR